MGKHKEWRKIAKKMRRKRIRTLKAKERDEKLKDEEEKQEQSPTFQIWLKEQKEKEDFEADEKERIRQKLNALWLENERLAKERWEKQQKQLERIKAEKIKQELKMKKEWEREQQKIEEMNALRKKQQEQKEREQAVLINRIEKYVTGESEKLPSSALTFTETQPGAEECPFFSKVAACRFKDSCSRNHIHPSISKTLLLPGFYSNFRIDHINQSNEYDTDVGLEYDEREIYQHFLEFYHDVLTEMKNFGSVVQFKTCCNEESHLRGNVYVQYDSERSAIKAFRALQGRFYGGKRISVEFCTIKSWSKALCGLFSGKKCPKGSRCNFLHVFRNPGNEFHAADRDNINDNIRKSSKNIRSERSEEWRWSTSPEISRYENNFDDESNKKDEEFHSERKSNRSTSRVEHSTRSRTRSRSWSRSRNKNKHEDKYKRRKENSSKKRVKREKEIRKRKSSRDKR